MQPAAPAFTHRHKHLLGIEGLQPFEIQDLLDRAAWISKRVDGEVGKLIGTLPRGRFTIGCHVSIAAHWLPGTLPSMLSKWPRLELQLVHELSRRVNDLVVSHELDFGIDYGLKHRSIGINHLTINREPLWDPYFLIGVGLLEFDGPEGLAEESGRDFMVNLGVGGEWELVVPRRVLLRADLRRLEQLLVDAADQGQRVLHLAGHTHWSDVFEVHAQGSSRHFTRWPTEALTPCQKPLSSEVAIITTQAASHGGLFTKRNARGYGFAMLTMGTQKPEVAFHQYGVKRAPYCQQ